MLRLESQIPVEEFGWIVTIDFISKMANEILLVEGRKVGAQEIVTLSKQTLMVNLI